MKSEKRGQGISLNVIIIAAIALIVLVILILIFTGRIGLFTTQVNECTNQGGACIDLGTAESADAACKAKFGDYAKSLSAQCTKTEGGEQVPDPTQVCCITATE